MGEDRAARKFIFPRPIASSAVHAGGKTRSGHTKGMPMAIAALLLPILAAAAQATESPPPLVQKPIVVTGRGGVPFISPMGEPIRARTPNEDTLARWFSQVDSNHDGYLTPNELVADAERYFAILDTNHDGQINPDELVHYEWTIAPEIQVNSRLRRARAPGEPAPKADADLDDERDRSRQKRDRDRNADSGPQGAARYALLNMPEPVAAADSDFNRAISLQEFRQAALDRFQLLDTKHEGRLTLQGLEALKPVFTGKVPKRRDEVDTRIGQPLPPGN
jgi:Ca2+-binding EF-hand superfamily protein